MSQFVLLIDGNFFAQRLRNAAGLNFIDNPEKDKAEMMQIASSSLASEIRPLTSMLYKVVICRDYSSWRKKFTQTYPIESAKTEEQQVYKDNRGHDITYDANAFYAAYDEWCDLVESKLNVPIVKTKGAEADDAIWVLGKVFTNLGKHVIIFSSDGDYYHCVSDKVSLIKMPKRELYLQKLASVSNDMMSVFGKKIDITQQLISKFKTEEVKYINPYKSLFQKIVSGDSKDNVPPIFFWKSKTAKPRTFKPSDSHFVKAFKKLGHEFSDVSIEQIYDESFIRLLISELFVITKQTRDLEHTYNVYVSNRKMKHLHSKEIPKEIMQGIITSWNEKSSLEQNFKTLNESKNILSAIGAAKATTSYFDKFKIDKKHEQFIDNGQPSMYSNDEFKEIL